MFRGLKPTFTREMPGYFFFFYAYELSRDQCYKTFYGCNQGIIKGEVSLYH
jgi:hypothetical protein